MQLNYLKLNEYEREKLFYLPRSYCISEKQGKLKQKVLQTNLD